MLSDVYDPVRVLESAIHCSGARPVSLQRLPDGRWSKGVGSVAYMVKHLARLSWANTAALMDMDEELVRRLAERWAASVSPKVLADRVGKVLRDVQWRAGRRIGDQHGHEEGKSDL